MRRLLLWAAGILAVVIVALVTAAIVYGPDQLKRMAQSEVRDLTGRDLEFAGPVSFDWNWNFKPRIALEDVRLSNAEWASSENMVALGRAEAVIDLGALLLFRIELPELAIDGLEVNLERRAEGDDNWSFPKDPVTDAAVPDDRSDVPVVGRLRVTRSVITYVDAPARIDVEARIAEILAEADRLSEGEYGMIDVAVKGRYRGREIQADGRIGSPLMLRDPSQPYPVRVQARAGKTRFSFDGKMMEPLAMEEVSGDFRIEGPNAKELFPLFGIATPATPPYALAGHVERDADAVNFPNVEGVIGDSDIAGSLSVRTSSDPILLTGDLRSRSLDYDDIGPLVGAPPGTGADETASEEQRQQASTYAQDERVLPDAPLDIERISAMDARINYKADAVQIPNVPVEALELELALDNRVLRLTPLIVSIAGGTATAQIVIDANQADVDSELDLVLRQLDMAKLTNAAIGDTTTLGSLDGRIRLAMTGRTIRTALGNADGQAGLMLRDGAISHLIVELAGLDAGQALGVLAEGDEALPIRCAVAVSSVKDGTASLDSMVVDTPDTNITAEGKVDLGEESLDISMLARPKDVSLLSARTPVTIGGRFANPSIGIDPAGVAARGGVAVGLSVLLTPLAGILGFLDIGTGEDANCGALLEQAKRSTDEEPRAE